MRYNVYMNRTQDVEMVVEASNETEADDIAYEAIKGARPDGLIEYWESDQPWEIETELTE